jgi:hypothetical protein
MMPPSIGAVLLVLLALGASIGCSAAGTVPGPAGGTPGSGVPSPAPEATSAVGIRPLGSPHPAESPGSPVVVVPSPSPGTADTLVALAIADAAQRTGADAADVLVLSVEPREWSDRSLGCPKPGVGYAQVITPGFLITLQVRGQQLEYHTDQAQATVCSA